MRIPEFVPSTVDTFRICSSGCISSGPALSVRVPLCTEHVTLEGGVGRSRAQPLYFGISFSPSVHHHLVFTVEETA
jgi:hypothetical protein